MRIQSFEEVVGRMLPVAGDTEIRNPGLRLRLELDHEALEHRPAHPEREVVLYAVKVAEFGRIAEAHGAQRPRARLTRTTSAPEMSPAPMVPATIGQLTTPRVIASNIARAPRTSTTFDGTIATADHQK